MHYYLVIIYTAMTMFFPVMVWGDSGTGRNLIHSIQYIGMEDGSEIVELKLSRKVEPKYLALTGEKPRAVFDFVDTSYSRSGKRLISGGGHYIQRIRVGLHHAPLVKTRVVLDLAKNHTYQIDQRYKESTNSFRISVSVKDGFRKTGIEAPTKTEPKRNDLIETQSEKSTSAIETPAKRTSPPQITEERSSKPSEKTVVAIAQEDSVEAEAKGPEETSITKNDTVQNSQQEQSVGFAISEADDRAKAIPEIVKVTWESSSKDKEMVLFKLNGFHPPVVFSSEENEIKVVCDFLDGILGPGINTEIDTGGKLILKVRTAKYNNPEKVRVVLDLAEKYNYDLKQVFFREDNLFVIIISNIGEKE